MASAVTFHRLLPVRPAKRYGTLWFPSINSGQVQLTIKTPNDENTPCNPVGPYALSKYNAELRAIEIARVSGMALAILRLATLYGEGNPGNVGRLMRALDRGRFLWIGDGSNRKSLLYRGDAARAIREFQRVPDLKIENWGK